MTPKKGQLKYWQTVTGWWVWEYDPDDKPARRSDWWQGTWHALRSYVTEAEAAAHVRTGKAQIHHHPGLVN